MLKNCIIKSVGVNPDHYHDQPIELRGTPSFKMSPSSLKVFRKNALKWKLGFEGKDSGPKDWGNLVDTLCLVPEHFEERYAVIPTHYETTGMKCPQCESVTDSKKCSACKCERVEVKIQKEWSAQSKTCQEWLKSQDGKSCIYEDELQHAQDAVKMLYSDETIAEVLNCSKRQVHVVGEWHDPATGLVIPVQCLIDAAPDKDSAFQKALVDLKSCRSADQEDFLWDAWRMGYHCQAGFDLDMYQMASRKDPAKEMSGEDRRDWLFILSESHAPYITGRRAMSEDFIDIGRQTYKHALALYARCVKTGKWPSYDLDEEFTMMMPRPSMEFTALSENMESAQREALEAPEQDPDNIP